MPEIPADFAASGCFSLHFGSGIEENQALDPDLFPPRARPTRARRAVIKHHRFPLAERSGPHFLFIDRVCGAAANPV